MDHSDILIIFPGQLESELGEAGVSTSAPPPPLTRVPLDSMPSFDGMDDPPIRKPAQVIVVIDCFRCFID